VGQLWSHVDILKHMKYRLEFQQNILTIILALRRC